MEIKKLLELRNAMKKKKPHFIRQNSIRKKLGRKWVRPSGIHSKMRECRGGKRASVQAGYSSPKAVRGLHKRGLKMVIINNLKDIESMDAKTEGAIIASKTGMKKKIGLIKKLEEKGIELLNIKNAGEFIRKAEQKRGERKKQAEEKKKKAAKDIPKKKLEEKLTEEEKKKTEKNEKDKVLTKREKK